ncbi:MAG TPA: alpha/beta fold hydrolase [Ktedonobacteraceae bacterium]|jgi:polyhydroxyalkanoate synthase|nr:alpha/beta fold hydrolase [Ktedonobacteraceae bacterium]
MSASSSPMNSAALQDELKRIEENTRTLVRVSTSRAKVAQTPKQVIWTFNKAKLYRYIPVVAAEQRHKVPLFLVFALMNKPYILDLRPGNSFIEYMVKQGYDVYLLDWGVPGIEDKDLKFDDYVLDYLPRAIRKIKAVSGSDEFTMLGWCIGAILSTIYAALRPDDGLKNLILLTAPLDFTDKKAGGFVRWVNDEAFDPDKIVSAFGNVPGEMIDYGAKALKPVENYIGSYLTLWDNLDNPRIVESWHAMNTWVTDLIPMAGATYAQLIKELYRENRLIQGNMLIRGERVDLSRIRANLLNVIALGDHISPPCQSESIMAKVSSEDQLLLKVKGGHIGMMAGSGALKFTWPHIDSWLAERSE